MESQFRRRIYLTLLLFVALFSLVFIKAFYLQLVSRDRLMVYLNKQILREVKIYPQRGQIYDRNGRPLAINVKKYGIFTLPEKGGEYKKLSKIIPELSYNKIKKKLENRKVYTWLLRNKKLTEKQVAKIKDLQGIYLELTPGRSYPNHELAAQTLGFVGVDNTGLAGIEYTHNDILKGKAKIFRYVMDAKGRANRILSEFYENRSKNLYLSLDFEIQVAVEKYLKEAVKEHGALLGGAGVLDALTGEILAVANYPTFDPNIATKYHPSRRKLSFVTDPFEPGSIFKIFTAAAGLSNNIFNSDTNYFCEYGKLKVENHIISEAGGKGHEWLSVKDIIKYSSNIGATKMAFDVTYPVLKETLKKFKFGEKTMVQFPGESRGILKNDVNISPLSLSNISFGQGVAATGIQVMTAYAGLVNGGYYPSPTFLKRNEVPTNDEENRLIGKKVSEDIINMLEEAVESGTATNARIPHYRIAAKTGTAQKANSYGVYDNNYISSIVGHPVGIERPFVIYVYIDSPTKGLHYANQVAGPLFKKITEFVLYKNGIAPTKKVHEQNVMDKINLAKFGKKIIKAGRMPDFRGLDKLSALDLLEELGVKYSFKGHGIVIEQYPLEGAKVSGSTRVELLYTVPEHN